MLTDTFIRSAPPGVHWDKSLKGFGLRVGKSRRTFLVLIASGRRKAIGNWPLMSLSEARGEAKRLLAEKTLGKLRPTRTAFADALTGFLKDCEQRNKPRTVRDYQRLLVKHYPFARQSLADITGRDILKKLNPLPPSERHHAFTAGRRFFRYCVQQHLIDRSPLENAAVSPASASRERVLTEDELRTVYRTARASATSFHHIVALCILTGQRRSEIGSLEWEWIKDDRIEFPAKIAKNRRAWMVPLGPDTKNLFGKVNKMVGSPYVFPATRSVDKRGPTTTWNGWGKAKLNFDRECGIGNWRLHDLRRTFSSNMARLGVQQIVVEKLLNHVSGGSQSQISQVYNRHAYFDEMRDALERWESYLEHLTR